MQSQNRIPHTNFDDLFQIKIPALKGRAKETNLLILETIAIDGPQLKYDVHKKLRERGIKEYSTVTRRIDFLKKRGYLDRADQRVTERGKQKAENMYGITWKGFIASFASENVRKNALQIIGKNPLLTFPEKEFVLLAIEEIFDSKEIEKIVTLLLWGCLEAIPSLEIVNEDQLVMYILQGLRGIPKPAIGLVDFSENKKDLTKLLDNPRILQIVKERVLPFISELENNFYLIIRLFEVVNKIGDFIKKLEPDDKPSERLKEYLKTLKPDLEEITPKLENKDAAFYQ